MQLEEKLRALPMQVILHGQGVILKRGCTEFSVEGPEAVDVVGRILAVLREQEASPEQVFELFSTDYRPAVASLLEDLLLRGLLQPASAPYPDHETNLDVLYWHFYAAPEVARARLARVQIVVLGVNHISRQLVPALSASGFSQVEVVDIPQLRNREFFDTDGLVRPDQWPNLSSVQDGDGWEAGLDEAPPTCLVTTSDFGGTPVIARLNELSVRRNLHFLPVVLQNLIGSLGPLVVPGETACYECLLARENSNMAAADLKRAVQEFALDGQSIVAVHPSMASILGDIAAVELTKFYTLIPRWSVGTLVEVNLMIPSLVSRKVLRIPRCRVCSSMNSTSSATLTRLVADDGEPYKDAPADHR
jgi:bacteriocin biosynthesis cyclodehydratase domain-containing protein